MTFPRFRGRVAALMLAAAGAAGAQAPLTLPQVIERAQQ